MLSEILSRVRAHWPVFIFIFLTSQTAYLLGYFALSEMPTTHVTDATFLLSVTGQTAIFWLFFLPPLIVNFQIAMVEAPTPMQRAVLDVRRRLWLVAPIFALIFLGQFIGFEVGPGLEQFLLLNLMIFSFYSAGKAKKGAFKRLRRVLRLAKRKPRKVISRITFPFLRGYFRTTSVLLMFIFVAWVGLLRYEYVQSHNNFTFYTDGEPLQAALLGRNAIGLVVRNADGNFNVIPIESIDSMVVIESQWIVKIQIAEPEGAVGQ